jgi:hypothetical protein
MKQVDQRLVDGAHPQLALSVGVGVGTRSGMFRDERRLIEVDKLGCSESRRTVETGNDDRLAMIHMYCTVQQYHVL